MTLSAPALNRYTLLILLSVWLVFLFIQTGNPYDESEHLHAAWLMEVERQVPVEDFFQHHTPLLWELLRIHFRLGGSGPGSLLFGRWIVVFCGAIAAISLWSLMSSWRQRDSSVSMAGAAFLFLIAATVLEHRLFVLRPETLSAAAMMTALALWVRPLPARHIRLWAHAAVVGALFALACFASPRFLLLAPTFLLLTRSDTTLLELDLRRFVVLLMGLVATLAGLLTVSSMSLANLLFSLQFSALLQSVGEGSKVAVPTHLAVAGLWVLLLAALVWFSPRPVAWKKRGMELGFLAVVAALSTWTAGAYPYAQAFICPLILGTVLLARWEALGGVEGSPGASKVLTVTIGAAAILLLIHLQLLFRAESTVFRVVGLKYQVAKLLEPGDTVLLSSLYHPISALDASYYGVPLVDSRNRLCEAVDAARHLRVLPRCDYLADLRNQEPRIVDQWLPILVPEAREQEVLHTLARDYDARGPIFFRAER